jgi:hypothetical protein
MNADIKKLRYDECVLSLPAYSIFVTKYYNSIENNRCSNKWRRFTRYERCLQSGRSHCE